MAPKFVSCVILALMIQGLLAEFVMEIDGPSSTVSVGDPVVFRCKVLGEDPRVSFHMYRYSADNTHEVISVGTIVTNEYLRDRSEGAVTMDKSYEKLDEAGNDVAYKLTLQAAQLEDNAIYGCGENEVIEQGKTATLTVLMSPDSIQLYGSESPLTLAERDNVDPYVPNQLLHIDSRDRGYFMCVAEGFIPAPELTLTFNGVTMAASVGEPIETVVHSETHASYSYKTYTRVLTTDGQLEMQPDASRQALVCEATVEGTPIAMQAVVRPVLRISPQIVCMNVTTKSGMIDQPLTCIVEADPDPTQVLWSWEVMGESKTLQLDQSLDGRYRATKEVMEDGRWKISLVLDKVFPQMFGTYKLLVVNEIDSSTGNVSLIRDPLDVDTDNGTKSLGSSFAAIFLCVATAIWRMLC